MCQCPVKVEFWQNVRLFLNEITNENVSADSFSNYNIILNSVTENAGSIANLIILVAEHTV